MAALALSLAVSACGGSGGTGGSSGSGAGHGSAGSRNPSGGSFPVQVKSSFPAVQRLAQQTHLVISIHNSGSRPMPDVAVTLTNPKYGTSAQALSTLLAAPAAGQPILASRSRPVWIIDQAPGPCRYSCKQGGPGGAATAYSNTWALGPLAPGHTVKFDWKVTAVQSGTYRVRYQVAPALTGGGHATGPSSSGQLSVRVSAKPRQAYVNNAGQIVYTQ